LEQQYVELIKQYLNSVEFKRPFKIDCGDYVKINITITGANGYLGIKRALLIKIAVEDIDEKN
jgi:hypothetical protein